MQQTILVTGSAGFIGFHVSNQLLKLGHKVIGVDNLSDYYDVNLKHTRLNLLKDYINFEFLRKDIADSTFTDELTDKIGRVDVIIHLAAQAGVRYSIDNPSTYLDTNIIGTFNILEIAKRFCVKHLLMASTSSVYGANSELPFKETQKCDTPMSFYAATKKATEEMGHAYAHIHKIPITMFRFFTVYGPWGRPDMALFKFIDLINKGQPIDVYNYGDMQRDFTFIDDLVSSIINLVECVPNHLDPKLRMQNDSMSRVAPFRVVNIGNSNPVSLMSYIEALESALNKCVEKNFLPIQPGDVPKTASCTDLLFELTGDRPSTDVQVGVQKFVDWYRHYKDAN